VDAADRVLMLRYRLRPDDDARWVWMTPGGGVRWWESLRKAAAREVREEVGLVVNPAALGTPVAHAEGFADLGWAKGRFRDDYFLCRVDAYEVDVAAMESLELSHYAGHTWWNVAELRATADNVVPWGLADLLEAIVTGGPAGPIRLPWHH
jgi:8-oxo-dGTP pyrophosphatase MutT (NUDIX family)